MSVKTCKICKAKYQPFNTTQRVCSGSCALVDAKEKQAKKIKQLHAKEKKLHKLNDKPFRAKEAQKAFNAYIRARDMNEPCISCQRHHTGQYHAGHYISVGAAIELRFEELNVHKQCAPCNNHLSGNAIKYRVNLKKKIGKDKVDWLEGFHPMPHHSASDLLAIEQQYKLKLKELNAKG